MLPERVRVAVVGAGFAGIGAAVRLAAAGQRDVLVLEQADAVGGTWRDNTYPGCACDVPSHLYSFSFAPNPGWTRSFSPQEEIRRYLEDVCDRYGVRDRVRLGVALTGAAWDPAELVWRVETSAGPLAADVLVGATGPLSAPAVPALPGAADFAGTVFHSARWDHGVDLAGARVAVVGTGASAVQFVPAIAPVAAHTDVYQRTPPWVLPRGDHPIGPRRRRLFARRPVAQLSARAAIWAAREAGVGGFVAAPALLRGAELVARRHLAAQVPEPELRALLTPTYRAGCKRLLLSDDWYPTLRRDDVTLVPAGVRALTRTGVVAGDGVERPADVVILGTGFTATDPPFAHHVRGRDGRTLAATWADGGMRALRGSTVAGFPNLFLVVGPNTGLGHSSMILMIEAQLRYLVSLVAALDRGPAALEPTVEAQERWNADVQRRMRRTVWATGGCSSWYQDRSGRIGTLWPGSTVRFRRATRAVDPAEYRAEYRPAGRRPEPAR